MEIDKMIKRYSFKYLPVNKSGICYFDVDGSMFTSCARFADINLMDARVLDAIENDVKSLCIDYSEDCTTSIVLVNSKIINNEHKIEDLTYYVVVELGDTAFIPAGITHTIDSLTCGFTGLTEENQEVLINFLNGEEELF